MLQTEYAEERKMMEKSKSLLKEMDKNDKDIKKLIQEGLMKEEELVEDNISIDELGKDLEEVKQYSEKIEINNREVYINMLKRDLDKIAENPLMRLRLEQQIAMLENLFSLSKIANYSVTRKFDKKVLKDMRSQVRKKLSINRKYTFTEPSRMETSLRTVLDDKKLVDRIVWRVYNFILDKKMELEGTYIYFLILTLSSIDYEDMKDREVVIENLKKLF